MCEKEEKNIMIIEIASTEMISFEFLIYGDWRAWSFAQGIQGGSLRNKKNEWISLITQLHTRV